MKDLRRTRRRKGARVATPDEPDTEPSVLAQMTDDLPAHRPRQVETTARATAAGPPKTPRPRAPDLLMEEGPDGRGKRLRWDHADREMAGALAQGEMGTDDHRLFNGVMAQLVSLGPRDGSLNETALNFALAAIGAAEPRDGLETLLATQMAAVHLTAMQAASAMGRAETIEEHEAYARAFNRLTRTFAGQMDALKCYRSRGRQVVRVERVTVNEGGQAIVGAVETGRRAAVKSEDPGGGG